MTTKERRDGVLIVTANVAISAGMLYNHMYFPLYLWSAISVVCILGWLTCSFPQIAQPLWNMTGIVTAIVVVGWLIYTVDQYYAHKQTCIQVRNGVVCGLEVNEQ